MPTLTHKRVLKKLKFYLHQSTIPVSFNSHGHCFPCAIQQGGLAKYLLLNVIPPPPPHQVESSPLYYNRIDWSEVKKLPPTLIHPSALVKSLPTHYEECLPPQRPNALLPSSLLKCFSNPSPPPPANIY